MASPTATGTRERILDVALDLFVRKGYAETSLRELAAELGFTKAALYYHFESKQDILLALHLRVHGLTADVIPMLREEGDPAELWSRIVERLIGIALQNRRLLELHLRNREAIAELHDGPSLLKHGPTDHSGEEHLIELLQDPKASLEDRVRRTASLGAIGGVLFAATAFADAPDDELEGAVRAVVRDILGGRAG